MEEDDDYLEIPLRIHKSVLTDFVQGLLDFADFETKSLPEESINKLASSIKKSFSKNSNPFYSEATKLVEEIISDFEKIAWYSSSHKIIASSKVDERWFSIIEYIASVRSIRHGFNIEELFRSIIHWKRILDTLLKLSNKPNVKVRDDANITVSFHIRKILLHKDLYERIGKREDQLYISIVILQLQGFINLRFPKLETAALQYLIGRLGRFMELTNGDRIEFAGPYDPEFAPKEDYKWLRGRARYYLDKEKDPYIEKEYISSMKKLAGFIPKDFLS